jgi:hypothetical protein
VSWRPLFLLLLVLDVVFGVGGLVVEGQLVLDDGKLVEHGVGLFSLFLETKIGHHHTTLNRQFML